ncbi:SID1 transmembrane family member [Trichinella spiralis]|uniref:SID1 transmembrane family member n=1 Tax=Trichinella spiralis TaxID=6334 RepID=A0ABR3KEW6_TRISP
MINSAFWSPAMLIWKYENRLFLCSSSSQYSRRRPYVEPFFLLKVIIVLSGSVYTAKNRYSKISVVRNENADMDSESNKSTKFKVNSETMLAFEYLNKCQMMSWKLQEELFRWNLADDIQWQYGKLYSGAVASRGSNVLRLAFNRTFTRDVIRISVQSSDARLQWPLLVVVRDTKTILSWQVPLALENKFQYNIVSRTLCPDVDAVEDLPAVDRWLYVELSTNSPHLLNFTVLATRTENFQLQINRPINLTASPPQPQFLFFKFPEDVDRVVIRVNSDDDSECMVVSIQPAQCPAFDLDTNVKFLGDYQTMTKKAAVTLHKTSMAQVHVVFVVKANPYECNYMSTLVPADPVSDVNQSKSFQVLVEKVMSNDDYLLVIGSTLAVYAVIYIVVFLFWLVFIVDELRFRHIRKDLLVAFEEEEATGGIGENYGAINSLESDPLIQNRVRTREHSSSVEEEEISLEKVVVRTKVSLMVADLARKPYKQNDRKYSIYPWNLLTIAIFYILPVVQLVLTYQSEVVKTGDQDLCFYNFECARPLWGIFAFNSVFSNVGYVLLGLLFLILVWMRDAENQRQLNRNEAFYTHYGIPQHYGLFYAMGMALALEGILSGCYHVCPNFANFQFDTAFMYMIAALSMLKIYQIRHPDINADSHVAYAVMAMFIFLAVIGVVYNGLPFWIVFSIFYAILIFTLSAEFYYKGQWRIERGAAIRIFKEFFSCNKTCSWYCPSYPDRMIFLLFGNVLNIAFIIVGIIKQFRDFPLYLVVIFISNLLLYLLFYIAMKMRHKEHLNYRAILLSGLSCISWGFSLLFFLQEQSSWRFTAAQSRELNNRCIFLGFYDAHDIWHFLSAISLFLSFVVLLVIDDDLVYTTHNEIPVF